MPGYRTRQLVVRIGGHDFQIRALSDLQQFSDPHGFAERLGISSAQWSLFGQVWPSGRVLAEAMCTFEIGRQAHPRDRLRTRACRAWSCSGARPTSRPATSIRWPNPFLARNSRLNGLPSVPYQRPALGDPERGRWVASICSIGSDILYERDHIDLLAGVLERHALPAPKSSSPIPGAATARRSRAPWPHRATASAKFAAASTRADTAAVSRAACSATDADLQAPQHGPCHSSRRQQDRPDAFPARTATRSAAA